MLANIGQSHMLLTYDSEYESLSQTDQESISDVDILSLRKWLSCINHKSLKIASLVTSKWQWHAETWCSTAATSDNLQGETVIGMLTI